MAVKELTKQVRFYEVVITNRDGVVDIQPGYWPSLRQHLATLSHVDRQSKHRGSRYVGCARRAMSPAQEYILFGHIRTKSDWPNTYDENTGDFGNLTVEGENGTELNLAEHTYLVDVPGTNAIALLGTSRAANISAIEDWLVTVIDNIDQGHSIQLLPVLDQQTQRKLAQASGISKLTVRVPKGVDGTELGDEGQVGTALSLAAGTTLGEMDVEITWNSGHGQAPTGLQQSLLRQLRSLVGGRPDVEKVKATLVLEDEDGHGHKEMIDFMRQRVAYPVKLIVDQDQVFSEESALRAMLRTINTFRADVLG